MSKFTTMVFRDDSQDTDFVAHANKFSKEEVLLELEKETGICNKKIEDIEEAYCKYYVSVPNWCDYDGEGGCYCFCGDSDKGRFPVYKINLRNSNTNN